MTHLPAIDNSLETAYRESLKWLFEQTRSGARRDPERMSRLVDALGLDFPARAAHVVGTNGKGTVTALIASVLAAEGERSGCFVSPHVEDFRERIAVNGEPIGAAAVVAFVERVRSTALPLRPSFFELTLAMALDHFASSGVTFAAVEAGVGARFDATSILPNVAVSVLTPISLDHVSTLGPTLADVATDKAAVLRPGVSAVSAAQPADAVQVLRSEARRIGAPLYIDDGSDDGLFAPVAGILPASDPVRRENERVACAAVRALGGVGEQAIRSGLAMEPLPGRGERFVVEGVRVLLDGAHDPAAAAALLKRAGGEFTLLFGSLPRKQGEATLRALEPEATRVFVTRAGGEQVTVEAAPGRTVIESPERALEAALTSCRNGELLVIAGSLYLAGELRPLLRARAEADTWTEADKWTDADGHGGSGERSRTGSMTGSEVEAR